MSRRPKKEEAASGHFEWDKETLRRANMDAAQGAELARGLIELSEKRSAEELDESWQEARQMSAIWTPHLAPILERLRKKGVNVDELRALIEQGGSGQKPGGQMAEAFAKQRDLILEAISEVADVGKLERQIRAAVSSRRPGCFTYDSVLAVIGGEEE
jgi:hypothetical protein